MRLDWFTHPEALDTDAANELLSRYAARKVKARKVLATDPRLWIVSALLPVFREEPKPSRVYQSKIWG